MSSIPPGQLTRIILGLVFVGLASGSSTALLMHAQNSPYGNFLIAVLVGVAALALTADLAWTRFRQRVPNPYRLVAHSGFAVVGWGIPAALLAKAASLPNGLAVGAALAATAWFGIGQGERDFKRRLCTGYLRIDTLREAKRAERRIRRLARSQMADPAATWLSLNLVQCLLRAAIAGVPGDQLLEARVAILGLLDRPLTDPMREPDRQVLYLGLELGRLLDDSYRAGSPHGGSLVDEILKRGYRVVDWDAPPPNPFRARLRYEEASRRLTWLTERVNVLETSPEQVNWVRREWMHLLALAEEALWYADDGQRAECASFVAQIAYFNADAQQTIAGWDQLLARLPKLLQLCARDRTEAMIHTVEGSALFGRVFVDPDRSSQLNWLDRAAEHFERQLTATRDPEQRSRDQVQLGRVLVQRAILHKDAETVDRGLEMIMEASQSGTDPVDVVAAVGWLAFDARRAIDELGSLSVLDAPRWANRWRSLAAAGLETHVNVVLAAATSGDVRGEQQHPLRLLQDAALQGAELLLELGRVEEALILLERGRLVALGAAIDIQSRDAAARREGRSDLVDKRVALGDRLAALEELEMGLVLPDSQWETLGSHSRKRQDIAETARRCRAQLASVTDEIRRVTHIDFRAVDLGTLREAAAHAPLLYVFTTEEIGHAILLQKDLPATYQRWAVWLDNNYNGDHPFQVVKSWRTARSQISDHGRAVWSAQADITVGWLRQTLAPPLERLLEPIDDLVIIPCGALAELPLHAVLGQRPGGPPRIVRYGAAARVLSERARAAAAGTATQPRPGLLAVAVPDAVHAPDAAHLVASEDLAKNALSAFATRHNQFLDGCDATRTNVSAQLPRFDVVHFSCHGSADVLDPMAGGLELVDGRLTLRDILSLRLPAARLAVVSACEGSVSGTALPDELDSFATGLVQVGFSGVIAGMWQIRERAAYHLLSRFYDEWAQDPKAAPTKIFARAFHWLCTATVADVEAYPMPGERRIRRANPSPELLARLAYPDADSWAALAYYGI